MGGAGHTDTLDETHMTRAQQVAAQAMDQSLMFAQGYRTAARK